VVGNGVKVEGLVGVALAVGVLLGGIVVVCEGVSVAVALGVMVGVLLGVVVDV